MSDFIMKIPLELRHYIYQASAERPEGSINCLRRWFEKEEVNKAIAAAKAKHPDTTLVAVYDDAPFSDSDDEFDDDDGDSEDESDEDGEGDSEDEDEDSEGEDSEDDDAEDAHNMAIAGPGNATTNGPDNATINGPGNATTVGQTPPPKIRAVRPHPKWRHIPKFIRISAAPPPWALFSVSKQLNQEANDWFYNVAEICIDVTGSFCHTSMFETALDEIVGARFSPFKNIRKVEVRLVWDTLWLRGPDSNGKKEFFSSVLHIRVDKVLEVLQRAPQLKKLSIQWHDSVKDDESASRLGYIRTLFESLPVTMTVEEHYLDPGVKATRGELPRRKTAVGKKRLEFQWIADAGFPLR